MKKEMFFCDVCGNECGAGIQKRIRLESGGLIIRFAIASISAHDPNAAMCVEVKDICLECLDFAMLDQNKVIA